MKIRVLKNSAKLLSVVVLASCASQATRDNDAGYPIKSSTEIPKQAPVKEVVPVKKSEVKLNLPDVPREFRAAWVATVANINWPTVGNFSTERQKAEAIAILDGLKSANFNAVIFQARPSADALYKSNLEPWSYFLTGEIGRAPSPYYDPLEFWTEEAHKRGMELHVWLNPYRAHHSAGGSVTEKSLVRKMPQQVVRLKNGMYWMDPSDPETQNHTAAVIKDLVARYNIDGIHIDDYFYPYKEYNNGADFPDERTWNIYLKSGGTLSRGDWRRANVNKFIKRIYDDIKSEKNYVKFGISPFGIWKPGYPSDIKGLNQYEELFADAKLWLNQGWCDYFSPQLYWKIDSPGQNFNSLLNWWESENKMHRHFWPGINTVEVKNVVSRPAEISSEIYKIRTTLLTDAGAIHWNADGVLKSPEMMTKMQSVYKVKALAPLSPWLKMPEIAVPTIKMRENQSSYTVTIYSEKPVEVFHRVVYKKYGDTWEADIVDGSQTEINLPKTKNGKNLTTVAIKDADRLGNLSDYTAQIVK